jgi:deoxyadenosine/deoxycytidine kinase
LNGAVKLSTSTPPQELLAGLEKIEADLGRHRGVHWAARTLDLDLLLYDDLVCESPRLTLPHPRMSFRRFVLEPAAEIAGELRHPAIGWTVARLLDHLRTAVPYVAVAGIPGAGKSGLAGDVFSRCGARLIVEPIEDELLSAFYANPAQLAWLTEMELLQRRVDLLRRDAWAEPQRPAISDFWFGQSLAFASVWLRRSETPGNPPSSKGPAAVPPDRLAEFQTHWHAGAAKVMPPKLIVWLDLAPQRAAEHLAARGRPYEQALALEWFQTLRQALDQRLRQPDQGPLLRLTGDDFAQHVDEVVAAIAAME